MLTITIEGDEFYDEATNTFSRVGDVEVSFEHSLVSLSKWEAKYQTPLLSPKERTSDEILDYIKCMIVTPDIDPDILYRCSQRDFTRIQEYIDSKESATTFVEAPGSNRQGETITSELIYYWMTALNIPLDTQHWHLNRLFSLINIARIKQFPPKKMAKHEIAARNREENERRLKALNTSG